MRVITLATIKGGMGKTVLATHVAACLAERGIETLLVDLDPQGHATLISGIDAAPDAPCVGDALLKGANDRLASVIIQNVRPYLSVAPAVLRMAMIERQLYSWALRVTALQRALGTLKRPPEAVVIDTPPHIGAFTEAALHIADVTVAPIPALAGALQGLTDLQAAWTEMQDGKPGILVAAANLVDQRTKATNAAFSERLTDITVPLLNTRIPKAEPINQACLGHKLLMDVAPAHDAVGAFREISAEIWMHAKQGTKA